MRDHVCDVMLCDLRCDVVKRGDMTKSLFEIWKREKMGSKNDFTHIYF